MSHYTSLISLINFSIEKHGPRRSAGLVQGTLLDALQGLYTREM